MDYETLKIFEAINVIENMRLSLGRKTCKTVTALALTRSVAALDKQLPASPFPDGDTSILACACCGSGEYLHNEDGNRNKFCGQCGKAIDWESEVETK